MIKRGPLALAIAKQTINRSLSADLDTGLYLEFLAFSVLMETEDKREGTQAFAERRPAKLQGKQVPSHNTRKGVRDYGNQKDSRHRRRGYGQADRPEYRSAQH